MSISNVDTAEVLEMLTSGCTPRDVACKHGVSEWAVRIIAKENGHSFGAGPKSRVDDSRLRELVGECRSQREIAAVFGVCTATIRARMRRLGLKPQTVSEGVRSAVLRGVGPAKLSEDKVVAMREDKRLGLSDKERASKYGVSKTAAREASDGETWGYIAIPVCTEIGGANA